MNEVEQRVQQFVREGHLPVMSQPSMLERVERGMRRQRRAKGAVLAVASVLVVGGLAYAATSALTGDSNGSSVAADPANSGPSDCSAVSVLAAATSTAANGSARDLAIVLSHSADSGDGAECVVGAGTRVDLGTGQQALSVEAPGSISEFPLVAGGQGVLQLKWSNWCGTALPPGKVTFTDGSAVTFALPEGTETPDCAHADKPSALAFESLDRTDVQEDGSVPGQ